MGSVDLLIYCIIFTIWILLAIAVIKKNQYGVLLCRFSEKRTVAHFLFGIMMLVICSVFLSFSGSFPVSLKTQILLGYITAAVELFYFGYTSIQFRKHGLVYNSISTKYTDIESYEWLNAEVLIIKKRKGLRRKIKILIKPEDNKRIDECIDMHIPLV